MGGFRDFSQIFEFFFKPGKKKLKIFRFFFSTFICFLTNIDELNTNMKFVFGCDFWLDHNMPEKRSKKQIF